jgi:hypothetical protein
MGPPGNPMLRFAVWALRLETGLTQLEIGQQVGCTSSHVAVIMNRMRSGGENALVKKWMEEFRKRTQS